MPADGSETELDSLLVRVDLVTGDSLTLAAEPADWTPMYISASYDASVVTYQTGRRPTPAANEREAVVVWRGDQTVETISTGPLGLWAMTFDSVVAGNGSAVAVSTMQTGVGGRLDLNQDIDVVWIPVRS